MKKSKKPLTFAAVAASIGALSMAVESCVYGPPIDRPVAVYGPPPETTITEETDAEVTESTEPSDTVEELVYGPPADMTTFDDTEVDVYGPPPGDE